MPLIYSQNTWSMSRLSNETQIWRKIFCFSGIISDISEYISLIFTIDGHLFFLLYLRKPAGDFWGLLAGDPWQYSLTPCKNLACY